MIKASVFWVILKDVRPDTGKSLWNRTLSWEELLKFSTIDILHTMIFGGLFFRCGGTALYV